MLPHTRKGDRSYEAAQAQRSCPAPAAASATYFRNHFTSRRRAYFRLTVSFFANSRPNLAYFRILPPYGAAGAQSQNSNNFISQYRIAAPRRGRWRCQGPGGRGNSAAWAAAGQAAIYCIRNSHIKFSEKRVFPSPLRPHTPTTALPGRYRSMPTVCVSARDAQGRTSAAADLGPFSCPQPSSRPLYTHIRRPGRSSAAASGR